MINYLSKWIVASLVMPFSVMILGSLLSQTLILFFWPGSIVLLSLGASENTLSRVIYVWSVGVSLNIVLYIFIGLLGLGVFKFIKSQSNN